jgi:membrane protein
MIAVWSAGKGMLSIIRGLQVIYQIDEYRSYLNLRMMASFYTILTMVGFLFSQLVLVFGQKIYRIFLMDIPLFQGINRLLQYGRFLTTILVLGIIFSGLYAFVPGKDIKRKKSLLWGGLAAISCTVFSFGFSLYINGWKSPLGYGNIRYIIMIMLWLYGNIYIVLFWAYLQKTYEK